MPGNKLLCKLRYFVTSASDPKVVVALNSKVGGIQKLTKCRFPGNYCSEFRSLFYRWTL
jgi:hypothetical protein